MEDGEKGFFGKILEFFQVMLGVIFIISLLGYIIGISSILYFDTSREYVKNNGGEVLIFNISNDISQYEYKNKIKILNITLIEEIFHNKINERRKSNNLKSLKLDLKLSEIAREHSEDMGENNFFEHTNLKGEEPTDRANNKNYKCKKDYRNYYTDGIGENIHQGNSYEYTSHPTGLESIFRDRSPQNFYNEEQISEIAVERFMKSKGHREIILTKEYDKEGVGVFITEEGKVFVTQNFC